MLQAENEKLKLILRQCADNSYMISLYVKGDKRSTKHTFYKKLNTATKNFEAYKVKYNII